MAKLRKFSGHEVRKILQNNGFVQVRQRGSHVVMQKRTATSTTTVPVPNHKQLRIGTLRSIIRQSKLSRTLFES